MDGADSFQQALQEYLGAVQAVVQGNYNGYFGLGGTRHFRHALVHEERRNPFSFELCRMRVMKVSKKLIDLMDFPWASTVSSEIPDLVNLFLQVLKRLIPVGLSLLATGMSLIAQNAQVEWQGCIRII